MDLITHQNAFAIGGKIYDDESTARKVLKQYPPGKKVKVYYHPENPTISCLESGCSWDCYLLFVFGLLFILIGFYGIYLGIYYWWQSRCLEK